jgi:hypothetical protein
MEANEFREGQHFSLLVGPLILIAWSATLPAGTMFHQIELLVRVLQLPRSLAYIGLVLNHGRTFNDCAIPHGLFVMITQSELPNK